MNKVKELLVKSKNTLKDEGVKSLTKKSAKYIYFKTTAVKRKYDRGFKDILFVNGCSLPHPQRYRVVHQIEQLEAYGISCDKIYYTDLKLDNLRYYRGFVFYRCPIIPEVENFIKVAKENNKTIFYDIDDLVFDVKDTNKLKVVQEMSKEERDLYNDGVLRMGKTLDLCEYGIASTERLQTEMGKHLKEVFVNRNVASEEMIKYSEEALKNTERDKDKVVLGYLSGTITHNDDFKMIMPSIIDVLKKYDNVYLKIVGLLDLPKEMEEVKDKVLTSPFVDWKELPKLIRSIDINLAPLEDSIFNEAKSENKWTEAALVKIPTIASNVGAFKQVIEDGITGVLCSNKKDWDQGLERLISDQEYREEIANNAYQEVTEKHTTVKSGKGIAKFIYSKLRKNVCFVLPSTNVSGGIMVAVKHGLILKEKGYDVTVINVDKATSKVDRVTASDNYLLVAPKLRTEFLQRVDTLVATMWLTLEFVQKYFNCKNKKYLVQGMESEFYEPGVYEKIKANGTYYNQIGIEYITISKWCQKWLKDRFDVEAKYAPNGIDLSLFSKRERSFNDKIKILIEGNCKDFYKNIDESFEITNKLDKNKYEIHYLSYEKEPKKWYKIDKFYHKIPHSEVGKIYENCDILLKTSLLDSFSYPPLEMMATGGVCVVVPNDGNIEYLKDNENCLLYQHGNIEEAIADIEKLVNDKNLRAKLINAGIKTAHDRDWKSIEKEILKLYL
ncbi:MAG: glycosyltransferase [Bacilli bacterium]|nr:glycosyltransferase [Bacilli bacterium]